ncbi:MAG: AAA domain-containing protein, partial [Trueperaceae bacterium]
AYFEERGIDTLFLAYGMATWTTTASASTPAAPVLLRPLKFEARGAAASDFDVSLHGDWDVNATLLHLLATEYNIELDPAVLLELLDIDGAAGAVEPARLFERLAKDAGDVPDFGILDRLVVGTFAYTKLPMVKDLQDNVDALAAHDLISALAGDEDAQQTVRELRARDVDASLPDYTPPADEFIILDADSSQNRAINAAVAGEPLIIQGPPGTGKSQTIANLIATLTARGKRVLFVAEKRAAIDAVTKRLRKVGLGDLVMDLHGGVTSKKQLAADLAHTLDAMARVPQIDVTDLHHRLETTRAALTGHAAAMHEVRSPWGVTMWQVAEQLLKPGAGPQTSLRFSGRRLEDLDADVARLARDHLTEWAGLAAPLNAGDSPWAGAKVTTDADARQVLDIIDELANDAVPDARSHLDDVLAQTALPTPASVDDWQRTLALLSQIAATLTAVTPGMYALNLDDTVDALTPAGRSWWSRTTAQLFDGRYRAAKKTVRELWQGDSKPDGTQLYETAAAARQQTAAWQSLGGAGVPRLPEQLQQASDSYQQLTERLAALAAYHLTADLRHRPHVELGHDVHALLADQQTLFRLPRIHELERWLEAHHLAPLLQAVRTGDVDADRLADVFDHAWLHSIRTQVSARDPRMANFDGKLQDQRVEQFRAADVEHVDSTAVRVRRAVAEQATVVCDQAPGQDQLVRKEANKKT